MDGLPPQFPPHPRAPQNSGFNSASGTRDIIRYLLVIIVVCLAYLLTITYMYCIQRRQGQPDDHQAGPSIGRNLSTLSGIGMARMAVHMETVADIVVYGSQRKRLMNEDCVICLASFENGEECKVLRDCRHVYHKECIDEWIWRDGHCPLCRVNARVVRRVAQDLELGVFPFP